ncbi:hypothetical protein GIB67_019215 [Kingdonia uniflora]|uniref:ubiquitinyl hydrolase 1 n=1 Tax=Kingdonia uniflora TaxID=39325 RepID=A0A7J7MZY8_9MAGN|nr:hypothetical protein GIB67_019215 [Kingdonia uniflora]
MVTFTILSFVIALYGFHFCKVYIIDEFFKSLTNRKLHINVLIAAVEGKGKEVVWHDRRNGADTIGLDDGSDVMLMGIVLNIPVKKFVGIWRGRHWVTLRRIEGVWYNLDSDLVDPYSFKDTREVKDFIDYVIRSGGEALFVFHKNGNKDQETPQV